MCNNCSRRSNPCEYDLVPKRRGPDKRPGTRQRSCKKRPADGSAPPPPKRKRTTTDRGSESQRDHTPVKPKLETVDTQRTPPLQQYRTDSSYPLHPHSASSTSPDLRLGPDPSLYKVLLLALCISIQLTDRSSSSNSNSSNPCIAECPNLCTIKVYIPNRPILANSTSILCTFQILTNASTPLQLRPRGSMNNETGGAASSGHIRAFFLEYIRLFLTFPQPASDSR